MDAHTHTHTHTHTSTRVPWLPLRSSHTVFPSTPVSLSTRAYSSHSSWNCLEKPLAYLPWVRSPEEAKQLLSFSGKITWKQFQRSYVCGDLEPVLSYCVMHLPVAITTAGRMASSVWLQKARKSVAVRKPSLTLMCMSDICGAEAAVLDGCLAAFPTYYLQKPYDVFQLSIGKRWLVFIRVLSETPFWFSVVAKLAEVQQPCK